MNESKFKVNDWVWSTKENRAVKVTDSYESDMLFTVSVSAANRFSVIYSRYAYGEEILQTEIDIDRIKEGFKNLWGKIKDKMDEDNLDNFD